MGPRLRGDDSGVCGGPPHPPPPPPRPPNSAATTEVCASPPSPMFVSNTKIAWRRTMHVVSEPAILYLGTPVVVISTVNEDGSCNLAPMSSAFWLGWRCLLGLDASSKTPQNLIRTGECVLNLPSEAQVDAVNRLALTTGTNPVPDRKLKRGYRYEPDKLGVSGFTAEPSHTV